MHGTTIHEFDKLIAVDTSQLSDGKSSAVPLDVFHWLESECLRQSDNGNSAWLRFTQHRGCRALQVTSFVGVIRAPNGYQIEVLPKIDKVMSADKVEARQLLLDMLRCLREFRHIQTDSANLLATRMPLLEVFITEFLQAVQHVVKRGLRSTYNTHEDNLFVLRGKLLHAQHLRQNLFRADRFFTSHDEFTTDRPVNRVLHSALRCVLNQTSSERNQRLTRELIFHFADIPISANYRIDFQNINTNRGMGYYNDALAWAKLILADQSPLTGSGANAAPSLLFPMEAVFEAYVAKHLSRQFSPPFRLKTQVQSEHLVAHKQNNWFRMKPDLLVTKGKQSVMVLDTKWKILDQSKDNGTDKYCLSQSDFYQLYAYGQTYLNGEGDLVLVYPLTDAFDAPLPQFKFNKALGLRLWVLPFCLKSKRLLIPEELCFEPYFLGAIANA